MAKYRVLTNQELVELEKEFVDYLVVNGIAADDWEKIKHETPENADRIIELFSDVVLESVLRKAEFLELRTADLLLCFHCLQEKIILFGMRGGEDTNFLDPDFVQGALSNPPGDLEIFTSEKAYLTTREEELFQMLNEGHVISDGALYKALALAMADQQD